MSFKCGIFLLVLLCGIGYCAGVCYDQRWDCSDLAHRGDCQSNPYAMLRECPISCRVDCVPCQDKSWDCPDRKQECHDHPYAVIHHCPKACGACY